MQVSLVNGRVMHMAVVFCALALCGSGSPRCHAADANSMVVGVIRGVDECEGPDEWFSVFVLVTLADSLQVQSVTLTAGDGTTNMEMEFDPPWWYADVYTVTLQQLKQIAHGTWTIAISGPSPSVSTFTLNAGVLEDEDILPVPTVLYPTAGSVIGPNVVFSWSDPSGGTADALVLWLDQEHSDELATSLDGTIELDATSWAPQCALPPGWADFGILYCNIDPVLVGPLTVESGAIVWAADPWSPHGYPDQTPLLLIGAETEVCFVVDNSEPFPCCPADITGNGSVGVPDLLALLACWGPVAPGSDCEPADLTGSGAVGVPDLLELLANWGPCPD